MTAEPIWVDVDFDHAVAREAVDVLLAAARRLDEQILRRSSMASELGKQWRGGHRDAWFDTFARLRSDSVEVAAQLRSDASRIEAAAMAARNEQARREQQRADWLMAHSTQHDALQRRVEAFGAPSRLR